jgi:hypothetical protein
MSTDLITGASGAPIINEPGSEDPFEIAFAPAKASLDAVIEMWKPLTWLDRRRRTRLDLFDPKQAAELIELIPPGHRIAEAGALFLQAEEVPAPEAWVHVAIGVMLQEFGANVSDAFRCGVVDGAYRDPEIWGSYYAGFSAAVVVRSIRQARLMGALPSTGGFLSLCVKQRQWFRARHADIGTLMDLRYATEDVLEGINPEHPLLAGRYEDRDDVPLLS